MTGRDATTFIRAAVNYRPHPRSRRKPSKWLDQFSESWRVYEKPSAAETHRAIPPKTSSHFCRRPAKRRNETKAWAETGFRTDHGRHRGDSRRALNSRWESAARRKAARFATPGEMELRKQG